MIKQASPLLVRASVLIVPLFLFYQNCSPNHGFNAGTENSFGGGADLGSEIPPGSYPSLTPTPPPVSLAPVPDSQKCTVNEDGDVVLTNYKTLPFQGNLVKTSWGSTGGHEPSNLFWERNADFNDLSVMKDARSSAASIEQSCRAPLAGAQRWQDTYVVTFPQGTFNSEPSWLTQSRISYDVLNKPDYIAWRDFIKTRPQLWDLSETGDPMPANHGNYASWGGQWGHISPLTPLDAQDCPPMMNLCTWGDFYAYKWGQTAKLSGAWLIGLSDFSDSAPHYPSSMHGFNARIISAFGNYIGKTIPGSTTLEKADYIIKNHFVQWNDYLTMGYSRYYAALIQRMGEGAGRIGVVLVQAADTPGDSRFVGQDFRVVAKYLEPRSFVANWDVHTIQSDRSGLPMLMGLGKVVLAAAREPLIRNIVNLEAEDDAFWDGVRAAQPNMSDADQKEWGRKQIKRGWLEVALAHIADRSGNVRRAVAGAERDYWDVGTIDTNLQSIVQNTNPTRPFGPAVYYSVNVERAVEAANGAKGRAGAGIASYFGWDKMLTYKQQGLVVGYYVSDAALDKIKVGSMNAPSAWILPDAGNYIPADELAKLKAIAPVVTTVAESLALPNQPLSFSTSSISGNAFYDQNDRLIVTAGQLSAGTMNGSMTLKGLANGNYTLKELFTNVTSTITVSSGSVTVPISIPRWDTLVFSLVKQ